MNQAQPSRVLIVVAKRPAPGLTKTRLTPPLTPRQASNLYEAFLRDTLKLIRRLPDVKPAIAYLPQSARAYFRALAPGFDLLTQQGDNLGSRLDNALQHYLRDGCSPAVIMDSDSPTLPLEYLQAAFCTLQEGADVALGPCDDGGYYLIGLKHPAPRLLREVRMSTPTVTSETLALAAQEGLQVAMLPSWYDVDDAASLHRLADELRQNRDGLARHTRLVLNGLDV